MTDLAKGSSDGLPFVLVLAGGEGSRMGGAKPQRELSGMRLIDRAIVQARSFGEQIAIAVHEEGQIETDLPRIIDAPDLQGPLAGLCPGIDHAAKAAKQQLLLLPADMPFLPADLFDRLSSALIENPAAKAALAKSDGQIHPVCSLWRTETGDALPEYIKTGRRSLIGLAEYVGFVCADWDVQPDPFFNLNTPEDMKAAQLRLRS